MKKGLASVVGADRRLGRSVWALVDQAASSLGTVVLTAAIAHAASVADFGWFSTAFALSILALGASRAAGSMPLFIRIGEDRAGQEERIATLAIGWIAGSFALAALIALSVPLTDGRVAFVSLGLAMPFVTAQDAWRQLLLASGKPRSAAANDVLMLFTEVAAIALLALSGELTLTTAIAAWALGAMVASLFGHRQLAVRWRGAISASRLHFGRHGDLARVLLAEFVVLTGAAQIGVPLFVAVGGTELAASLRAAQVFGGLITMGCMALYPVATLEAQRNATDVASLRRILRVWAVAIGALSAASAGTLMVLPRSVGEIILGGKWGLAKEVLPFVLLAVIGSALTGVWVIGLRAVGAAGDALRVRLVVGLSTLALGTLGARFGGARGCAMGIAVSAGLGAALALRSLMVVHPDVLLVTQETDPATA